MRTRVLLFLLLTGLTLPAAAEFSTITKAYEVELSDLRLPGSAGGTLAFKECPGCPSQTIRVTGNTRYLLNGRSIPLEKFRAALDASRGGNDPAVIVFHHLESNVITGVKVRLR